MTHRPVNPAVLKVFERNLGFASLSIVHDLGPDERLVAAVSERLKAEGVDLIGLGRPLCVQTDGPARLLAGADSLPSYEADLGLLPKPLRFLRASKLLRTLDTFGTMY